jgi:hypothetical protein
MNDHFLQETIATLERLILAPTLVGAVSLSSTSRTWCYLPRTEMTRNPVPGGIIVILWASDSEVAFFKGSHKIGYNPQEFSHAAEGAGYEIQAHGDRDVVTISEGGM